MQPTRFLEVSNPRQALIRLCQRVNYGSILNLTVINGELSFDPAPDVLVDVRLDSEERPRDELSLPDFALCTEVCRLLSLLDQIENGKISRIEVRAGVPRRITLEKQLT
jgi:hypothetical protein